MKPARPVADRSPTDASPRNARIALLALVAAGFLAWANSFSGPFVFDDRPAILANPTLRSFSTALSPPRDGGTVAGRPLVNLSLALNHAISGTDVWSYHAANLVIHTFAGLTLFGLIWRTLQAGGCERQRVEIAREPLAGARSHTPEAVAFSATLLWLVHPLQTAAITYVIQRAESLCALFFLLTLYTFTRAATCHVLVSYGQNPAQNAQDSNPKLEVRNPKQVQMSQARMFRISNFGFRISRRVLGSGFAGLGDTSKRAAGVWLAGSALACLAGMACKEVMVVAPLVVLLYDRTFVAGTLVAALRARWRYYAALAATWLLLAWLIVSSASRSGTAGFGGEIAWTDYALTQCAAIVTYLKLAIWPHPLVFDYGVAVEQQLSAVWPEVLLVLALVAAIVVALHRWPAFGFLGAAFFLILAPSSSIVPIHTQTMAEHRMYLPLAALAVAITLGLHAWLGRRALPAVAVLALPLVAATHARNRDYQSAVALWTDTVAKRPDNSRARNHLGTALAQAGRAADAIAHYEYALRLSPHDAEAHNNLANALIATGRAAEALPHYEDSVRIKPDSTAGRLGLANALAQAGRVDDAIPHYEAAARLGSLDAAAHRTYGAALAQAGRVSESITHYERALQLAPGDAATHYNYGLALVRTRQFAVAIDQFRAAVAADAMHVAARVNLANALLVTGRAREAIVEYEAALRLRPDDPRIRANLAQARAVAGR